MTQNSYPSRNTFSDTPAGKYFIDRNFNQIGNNVYMTIANPDSSTKSSMSITYNPFDFNASSLIDQLQLHQKELCSYEYPTPKIFDNCVTEDKDTKFDTEPLISDQPFIENNELEFEYPQFITSEHVKNTGFTQYDTFLKITRSVVRTT
jgi:hypothetical protein